MANETNSALSGGLLVVVGILVALGAVYFFFGTHLGLRTAGNTDISINMPTTPVAAPAAPEAPAAPAAPAAE